MSILIRNIKREESHDEESDILGNVSGSSEECDAGESRGVTKTEPGSGSRSNSMEAEKRIRREIANSNERRRMQSINAGFQSLRTLLPHHEGEKLSKAAILQQTAEYIYNLEQEKTRLLSQNCQLMRQVQQHEGGDVPPKKRKTELLVATVQGQAISPESSDEGVGSLSPEPVGLVAVVPASNELNELRRVLERERSIRAHLEEQLRSLEQQLYGGQLQYQTQEIVEPDESLHTQLQETEEHELDMQLVAPDNVPPVAHTQTVVCESQLSRSPSPVAVAVAATVELPPRLPSALEAAIKAEPKVEVERLPSPATPHTHDDVSCGRIYVNTSRQNLETIVEAIRHLEGDHLFGDEPQQEVPLALTNKTQATERLLKVEMNPYLQFHASSVQQHQQSRPGVIVVKQHS